VKASEGEAIGHQIADAAQADPFDVQEGEVDRARATEIDVEAAGVIVTTGRIEGKEGTEEPGVRARRCDDEDRAVRHGSAQPGGDQRIVFAIEPEPDARGGEF